MNTQVEPAAFDVKAAGFYLGNLGRTTIYKLIAEGSLRALKIGKRTIIARADCDEYLASLRGGVPVNAPAAASRTGTAALSPVAGSDSRDAKGLPPTCPGDASAVQQIAGLLASADDEADR